MTMINQEMIDSNFKELVNAGIVLTGGTSLLAEMQDITEQIFDLPVRIGYPQHVGGVVDLVNTPQCATGVGLVIFGMRNEPGRRFRMREGSMLGRVSNRMRNWFKSII